MGGPWPPARGLDLSGSEMPARAARRFAVAACVDAGREPLAEAVALVVTELVTNAVLHTDGPGLLTVRPRRDGIWVAVTDPSPVPPRIQDHSLRSGTGRGLQLTRAFTQSWGYLPRTGGGKQVWALVTPESVLAATEQSAEAFLAGLEAD